MESISLPRMTTKETRLILWSIFKHLLMWQPQLYPRTATLVTESTPKFTNATQIACILYRSSRKPLPWCELMSQKSKSFQIPRCRITLISMQFDDTTATLYAFVFDNDASSSKLVTLDGGFRKCEDHDRQLFANSTLPLFKFKLTFPQTGMPSSSAYDSKNGIYYQETFDSHGNAFLTAIHVKDGSFASQALPSIPFAIQLVGWSNLK